MERRQFLKVAGFAAGIAAAPAVLQAETLFANQGVSVRKGKRPNIILIMADDMGFSDLGCYGGEIDTPNLNRLAANGMRFTRFYNTARCCPTRASLLTGLHPHQAGIGHMTSPPENKTQHYAGPDYPNYQGFMNRKSVTIAEVVKNSGYATMMTGKWHLGVLVPRADLGLTDRDLWPMQRGFERYYGVIPGGCSYFYPVAPRNMTLGNDPVSPESTTERRFYTTDAFTDHAIDFIKEEKAGEDRPYFLYLAYNCPHWPLHAHREEVEKYRGKYMMGWDKLRQQRYEKQIKMGIIKESWALSPRSATAWDALTQEKKEEMAMRMAYYAAAVDRMDQNIGKLVAYLKETDQLDNTLIMFLSDNGGCAEGGEFGGGTNPFDVDTWEHTYGSGPSYGEVWANASNTPFRKFKHYTHAGGMSTPFIAHWPAGIDGKGRLNDEAATLIDVMPTVIDLAGAVYPKNYNGNNITPITGVSLRPAFVRKSTGRPEPLFFEHENNAAIIDGDWKLVGTAVSVSAGPVESKWELYNIADDRTELHDLKSTNPEKFAELADKWLQWAQHKENNDTVYTVYPKP